MLGLGVGGPVEGKGLDVHTIQRAVETPSPALEWGDGGAVLLLIIAQRSKRLKSLARRVGGMLQTSISSSSLLRGPAGALVVL